jgi:DMSO/TMAO reductase YedYZ molybdopterin-dependent catalytic subunit
MPEGRIPPGQRVVEEWPRLDLGHVPAFDRGAWDFRVEGEVDEPGRWTYDDVLALPATRIVSDFHCVTGWSTLDNVWRGVSMKTVVGLVRPKETARSVMFLCDDGYSTAHPLSDLLDADVLLAYEHNGRWLPAEHGGPLRLIVPRKYAYKSAKWVRALRFDAIHDRGYWEMRGYSDTADPWKEDRYASPP